MAAAPLTTHARVRMQQRGIPPAALEALLEYGAERHDIGGDDAVITVGHRVGRWRGRA